MCTIKPIIPFNFITKTYVLYVKTSYVNSSYITNFKSLKINSLQTVFFSQS
jgi:hypothetical protein